MRCFNYTELIYFQSGYSADYPASLIYFSCTLQDLYFALFDFTVTSPSIWPPVLFHRDVQERAQVCEWEGTGCLLPVAEQNGGFPPRALVLLFLRFNTLDYDLDSLFLDRYTVQVVLVFYLIHSRCRTLFGRTPAVTCTEQLLAYLVPFGARERADFVSTSDT